MTGIASATIKPLSRDASSPAAGDGLGLIGATGFVGSNLFRQLHADHGYHSSNIAGIEGRNFNLLVCAGVRAVKWWANQNAAADKESIVSLLGHLRQTRSREVIVISTVDVYPSPLGVDENTHVHSLPNHAYGANRLFFEDEMKAMFPKVRIVRLPALFGPGLKKNVIYDLIHDNNLSGVHPDSTFQYYDVTRLGAHLQAIRDADLELVNLATEPVSTEEIRARFFPAREIGGAGAVAGAYDMRTCHAAAFGGQGNYIATKAEVLTDLGAYLAGPEIDQ